MIPMLLLKASARCVCYASALFLLSGALQIGAATIDAQAAARFAQLALDCVHREYPNKIAHVLHSDADAKPPRELTPAFFGCYDWHSAVHAHWLLARAARLFPDTPMATEARAALTRSLTDEHVARELPTCGERVVPRSSAPTVLHGCCSSQPSYDCGTIRRRKAG